MQARTPRSRALALAIALALSSPLGCFAAVPSGILRAQAPPQRVQRAEPAGEPVYHASECIGAVVNGRCHGTIMPEPRPHPRCYGQWVMGHCTGPQF